MAANPDLFPTLPLALALRHTRKVARVTQKQLAELLGITKLTVLRLENGHQVPHPPTRRLIEMWIEQHKQREEEELC